MSLFLKIYPTPFIHVNDIPWQANFLDLIHLYFIVQDKRSEFQVNSFRWQRHCLVWPFQTSLQDPLCIIPFFHTKVYMVCNLYHWSQITWGKRVLEIYPSFIFTGREYFPCSLSSFLDIAIPREQKQLCFKECIFWKTQSIFPNGSCPHHYP